ncbi:hypothetical protein PLESTM_001079900 [Pleodorina starrii]|nr:hypothetical protein PLESTM_001079900 [Pleodorina starrii]
MAVWSDYTWIVVTGCLAAFFTAYGIGANDVANAFGSSVAARTLNMRQALLIATVCEFSGSVLLGGEVTRTVASGIAKLAAFEREPEMYMYGMLCALVSSGTWLIIATYLGLPVSTTHSIAGAVLGFAFVYGGPRAVVWLQPSEEFPYMKGMVPIVVSWFVSPLVSGLATALMFFIVRTAILRRERSLELTFWALPVIVMFTVFINVYLVIYKGADTRIYWSSSKSAWVSACVAAGCTLLTVLVGMPLVRQYVNRDVEARRRQQHSEVESYTRGSERYSRTGGCGGTGCRVSGTNSAGGSGHPACNHSLRSGGPSAGGGEVGPAGAGAAAAAAAAATTAQVPGLASRSVDYRAAGRQQQAGRPAGHSPASPPPGLAQSPYGSFTRSQQPGGAAAANGPNGCQSRALPNSPTVLPQLQQQQLQQQQHLERRTSARGGSPPPPPVRGGSVPPLPVPEEEDDEPAEAEEVEVPPPPPPLPLSSLRRHRSSSSSSSAPQQKQQQQQEAQQQSQLQQHQHQQSDVGSRSDGGVSAGSQGSGSTASTTSAVQQAGVQLQETSQGGSGPQQAQQQEQQQATNPGESMQQQQKQQLLLLPQEPPPQHGRQLQPQQQQPLWDQQQLQQQQQQQQWLLLLQQQQQQQWLHHHQQQQQHGHVHEMQQVRQGYDHARDLGPGQALQPLQPQQTQFQVAQQWALAHPDQQHLFPNLQGGQLQAMLLQQQLLLQQQQQQQPPNWQGQQLYVPQQLWQQQQQQLLMMQEPQHWQRQEQALMQQHQPQQYLQMQQHQHWGIAGRAAAAADQAATAQGGGGFEGGQYGTGLNVYGSVGPRQQLLSPPGPIAESLEWGAASAPAAAAAAPGGRNAYDKDTAGDADGGVDGGHVQWQNTFDQLKAIVLHGTNVDVHQAIISDQVAQRIHAHAEVFDPATEDAFKYLQVVTAICDSFSHGANDVANSVGPFTAIWYIYRFQRIDFMADLPIWILVLGGAGIVLGLATYGYNIIRAIGVRLSAITPSRGFCIELSTAMVVAVASKYGLPVSTTHCQVGATAGMGLMEGSSGLNWRLSMQFFAGWVVTLLITGLMSAALFAAGAYAPCVQQSRQLEQYENALMELTERVNLLLNRTNFAAQADPATWGSFSAALNGTIAAGMAAVQLYGQGGSSSASRPVQYIDPSVLLGLVNSTISSYYNNSVPYIGGMGAQGLVLPRRP